MSALNGVNDYKWTHEICRIWCTKRIDKELLVQKALTPLKSPSKSSIGIMQNGIGVKDIERNPISQICCLCGMGEVLQNQNKKYQGLIKCAAIGCNVTFHPMCAVLVTKLKTEDSNIQQVSATYEQMKKDSEYCKEYSLELLEVQHKKLRQKCKEREKDNLFMVRGNGSNNHNKEMETSIIPVGFCGIHNPKRRKDCYGCTPGISKRMRIPYQS